MANLYSNSPPYSVANSPQHTFRALIEFPEDEIPMDMMVTINASAAEFWVRMVRSLHEGEPQFMVGLACEWKTMVIKGWTSTKIVTLQLCVENKCLILQLLFMDSIPQLIKSFMNDSSITFVGVGIKKDLANLRKIYGLECQNSVDLHELCGNFMGFPSDYYMDDDSVVERLDLRDYSQQILGRSIRKPMCVSKSDWGTRLLHGEQILFACTCACVSYKLGCKLVHREKSPTVGNLDCKVEESGVLDRKVDQKRSLWHMIGSCWV